MDLACPRESLSRGSPEAGGVGGGICRKGLAQIYHLSWSLVDATWESTMPPSEIWPPEGRKLATVCLCGGLFWGSICLAHSPSLWHQSPAEEVYQSPAEGARRRGCAIALPMGCTRGGCWRGAAVGNRRMPWEASYVGGRGALEGCAIALPTGCTRGCRRGAAVGNRRMPWEASYVGRRGTLEGCAIALPTGCTRGCRRGAAVGNRRMPWGASYVGRKGTLEGCAIALPGGCTRGCRRGATVGSRHMPWEASYVGGGARRILLPGSLR